MHSKMWCMKRCIWCNVHWTVECQHVLLHSAKKETKRQKRKNENTKTKAKQRGCKYSHYARHFIRWWSIIASRMKRIHRCVSHALSFENTCAVLAGKRGVARKTCKDREESKVPQSGHFTDLKSTFAYRQRSSGIFWCIKDVAKGYWRWRLQ